MPEQPYEQPYEPKRYTEAEINELFAGITPSPWAFEYLKRPIEIDLSRDAYTKWLASEGDPACDYQAWCDWMIDERRKVAEAFGATFVYKGRD